MSTTKFISAISTSDTCIWNWVNFSIFRMRL